MIYEGIRFAISVIGLVFVAIVSGFLAVGDGIDFVRMRLLDSKPASLSADRRSMVARKLAETLFFTAVAVVCVLAIIWSVEHFAWIVRQWAKK